MTELIGILFSGMALAAVSSSGDQEVRDAMEAWKTATLGKDGAALDVLLHDDLSYSHSNAHNQDKADVISQVTSGKSSVVGIDFLEQTYRVYGNTAVVKGRADFHNIKDGAKSTVPLDILHVWIKGPKGWQMVARQATRAQ